MSPLCSTISTLLCQTALKGTRWRTFRDGQLAVYMHDGFWYACDTYYDIMTMNKMAEDGMDLWRVWR